MSDPVLLQLEASPPRRYMGTIMLLGLGGLVIFLAFSVPFGLAMIALLIIGLAALFAAQRLLSGTAQVLELTETELRVQGGPVLAEVSRIRNVERGAFAFKPSNGFLLTLDSPHPRRWVPGLYWCFGRKVGIGGVTGAPQTKAVAEAIAVMLAARKTADT